MAARQNVQDWPEYRPLAKVRAKRIMSPGDLPSGTTYDTDKGFRIAIDGFDMWIPWGHWLTHDGRHFHAYDPLVFERTHVRMDGA